MKRIKNTVTHLFWRPIHPASLGLFRICFGLVLFLQIAYFIKIDFVQTEILAPILHFQFHYFQFLQPLPAAYMHALMVVLLIATVSITIGFWYRFGAGAFLIGFTYLWLLDKGIYNNHYYLISLLVFLLLIVNADAWGAAQKRRKTSIPNWQILVFKAQLLIVFTIAGINKINPYWLIHLQPMDYILDVKADISGIHFLRQASVAKFFSWSACLFDLFIIPFLWFKKTRKVAICFFLLFNSLNFWLFWNIGEIGIFPFLLIASLSIFLTPSTPSQMWHKLRKKHYIPLPSHTPLKISPPIQYFLIAYLIFQTLFPFRHLLIPGHVDWTGEAQRASWRMKIMLKEADIQFFVKDNNQNKYPVDVQKMLSPKQYNNLIYYPDLIPTIARAIKQQALQQNIPQPQINANFNVSFMGIHPKQAIVSPTIDLSNLRTHPFRHDTWIQPLNQ